MFNEKDYNKKIKDIIKLVCEETGVTYVELCSRRRTANLLKARAIYVAVCLKLTDFSLEEIGNTISKNHGTISRYAKKIHINIMTIIIMVYTYINYVEILRG